MCKVLQKVDEEAAKNKLQSLKIKLKSSVQKQIVTLSDNIDSKEQTFRTICRVRSEQIRGLSSAL